MLQFIPGDQSGRIAVIFPDIRHDRDSIFFMPGRSSINKTSAAIADVLQLHVLGLCPLSFRFTDTVLQVDDVICHNDVRMLSCDTGTNSKPHDLRHTFCRCTEVCVDLGIILLQELQVSAVQCPDNLLHASRFHDLLRLDKNLRHVVICLPEEHHIFIRINYCMDRQEQRQVRCLV